MSKETYVKLTDTTRIDGNQSTTDCLRNRERPSIHNLDRTAIYWRRIHLRELESERVRYCAIRAHCPVIGSTRRVRWEDVQFLRRDMIKCRRVHLEILR